jgi:hypothetical protein
MDHDDGQRAADYTVITSRPCAGARISLPGQRERGSDGELQQRLPSLAGDTGYVDALAYVKAPERP